jgi:hypothetical protein
MGTATTVGDQAMDCHQSKKKGNLKEGKEEDTWWEAPRVRQRLWGSGQAAVAVRRASLLLLPRCGTLGWSLSNGFCGISTGPVSHVSCGVW